MSQVLVSKLCIDRAQCNVYVTAPQQVSLSRSQCLTDCFRAGTNYPPLGRPWMKSTIVGTLGEV